MMTSARKAFYNLWAVDPHEYINFNQGFDGIGSRNGLELFLSRLFDYDAKR